VRITTAAAGGTKRPFSAFSPENPPSSVPDSNRDGRNQGDGPALRPAKKFTKFVDYHMSSTADTKGGFLSTEDDPHNAALGKPVAKPGEEERPKHMTAKEWERFQTIKRLQRNKAGPFEPGLSVLDDEATRKKCRECQSLEIDWVWEEVFGVCVCHGCKEKFPEKYSLLTKTECKEDYLLTDREFFFPLYFVPRRNDTDCMVAELRDAELLPHLSKPNPHKAHWHDMMLFLRFQVEEYAVSKKWGSAERLDAEFERREEQKKKRKEAKFKEKLLDLKKKTRSEAFRRQHGAKKFGGVSSGEERHEHRWGVTVENSEGATVKKCLECGMEAEVLEF